MKSYFENATNRDRFLQAVRKFGTYEQAYSLFSSRSSFERYCKKNPEFRAACEQAKDSYQFDILLNYSTELRKKAIEELEKRIETGDISDAILYKIAFETGKIEL